MGFFMLPRIHLGIKDSCYWGRRADVQSGFHTGIRRAGTLEHVPGEGSAAFTSVFCGCVGFDGLGTFDLRSAETSTGGAHGPQKRCQCHSECKCTAGVTMGQMTTAVLGARRVRRNLE